MKSAQSKKKGAKKPIAPLALLNFSLRFLELVIEAELDRVVIEIYAKSLLFGDSVIDPCPVYVLGPKENVVVFTLHRPMAIDRIFNSASSHSGSVGVIGPELVRLVFDRPKEVSVIPPVSFVDKSYAAFAVE